MRSAILFFLLAVAVLGAVAGIALATDALARGTTPPPPKAPTVAGVWEIPTLHAVMVLELRTDRTCSFSQWHEKAREMRRKDGVWIQHEDRVYVVSTHADGKRMIDGPTVMDWRIESTTRLRKAGSMIYLQRR